MKDMDAFLAKQRLSESQKYNRLTESEKYNAHLEELEELEREKLEIRRIRETKIRRRKWREEHS
jgi:hypothetical protein